MADFPIVYVLFVILTSMIGWTAYAGKMQLEFGASVLAFVTIFIGWKGLDQYRESVEARKSQHLYTLYENFFTEKKFDEGVRIVDYDYSMLSNVVTALEKRTNGYLKEQESLIQYLNFFLYLGFAAEKGNLNRSEISALFGYYFTLISLDFHKDQLAKKEQVIVSQHRLAKLLVKDEQLGFKQLAEYANSYYKLAKISNAT